MKHPLLENGMVIYAGKFDDEYRKEGRYYAIKYSNRAEGRGGFCKEAADFIHSLGIRTEEHWNHGPRQNGWRASPLIRVYTDESPLYHMVHPHFKSGLKPIENESLLHLLNK